MGAPALKIQSKPFKYSERSGIIVVQPWECHTRIPEKHIYVYSFGLRPEEH